MKVALKYIDEDMINQVIHKADSGICCWYYYSQKAQQQIKNTYREQQKMGGGNEKLKLQKGKYGWIFYH